jgi:hypothetical protein
LPQSVQSVLKAVIARQTRAHFSSCAALLLRVLPVMIVLQLVADRIFDLSSAVRLLLLVVDVAVVAGIVYWFAIRPWKRRLTLDTAALLIERKIPEFRTALVTVVELTITGPAHGSASLLQELTGRVSRQLARTSAVAKAVDFTPFKRSARWAAITLLVAIGLGLWAGAQTLPLLQRMVLLPVQLPTRTVAVPVSGTASLPLGSDFTLAARAVGEIPKGGRIFLTYANGDQQEIPATSRMDAPAEFSGVLKNVQQSFRYRIALNDGTTPEFQVNILIPPAMESVQLLQVYPDYTKIPAAKMEPGNLELRQGSRLEVEVRSNQPLKSAAVLLAGLGRNEPLKINPADPRSAKGSFQVPKSGLTAISFPLQNTDGRPSVGDTLYRVDVIPDNPPKVELISPTSSEISVLLRSTPQLVFTVREDFAIKKLTLRFQITRPDAKEGAPAENGSIPLPFDAKAASLKQTYAWELAKQKPAWTMGSSVTFWIEAEDNNTATGPGIGTSEKKVFAIVSEEEKRKALQELLGGRAGDIDAIYQSQKEANEELERSIRTNQP